MYDPIDAAVPLALAGPGIGVDPVLFEVGPVRLWFYGLAYAIGLLTVSLWVHSKRERLGFDGRDVAEFSVMFAAGVLLGGRIFDVALYEWFYYEDHPWQVPRIWEGGMATHGVLLGAVLSTFLFCRLRNKSFFAIADEIVLPATVLMALGRVGNHINGEVYGSVTDVGWAMRFPYAVGCRHPVALYDGLKNLLILPILLYVRDRYPRTDPGTPPGLLLGHFVFWYGFLRLFVDHFRDYDSYWLGIGRGQYFNLLMAVIGLGIILAIRRYAEPRPTAPRPAEPGGSTERHGARAIDAAVRLKRLLFYALVALCLTIPGGWTRQVLEDFETNADVAAPPVEAGCDDENGVR